MSTDTRALLRSLAALGATVAVLATFLPWYRFEVVIPPLGRVPAHIFSVPVTLWGFTTLAPILIVVAAVVAMTCITMIDGRVAGVVTGLVGLGILAYAIVRAADVPSLAVPGPAAAVHAVTRLDGGPFLALAGGLMLTIGALGDLAPAGDEALARKRDLRARRLSGGMGRPVAH
jgi:hypothetical protein